METLPPTIVTAISGGLGNQMFQYAIGRRFALAAGGELLLYPGTRYRTGSYRDFRLDRFRVAGRLATEREAGGLGHVSRARKHLAKLAPMFRPAPDPEIVRERDLRFDAGIMTRTGSLKFDGYW